MPKYEVHVEHRNCEVWEVEADNPEEARKLVNNLDGMYVGTDCEEDDYDVPNNYIVEKVNDDDEA